jgi:hypothetical protein
MRFNSLLLFLFSIICALLFSSKRNADAYAASIEQKSVRQIDKLSNILFLQTEYTNPVMIKDIQMMSSTLHKASLSDIISKHGWTLIYRFTSSDCFECVNVQLGLLKEKFPSSVSNIKIIATYPGMNDLNVVNKENDLRFAFFNTDDNHLKLVAEQLNTPYFFLIDSALQVRNLFIPEKGMPDLTRRYFNHIESLL